MCTAATYQTDHFYFGRTLDYDCSYGECIAVTPRRYEFTFREAGRLRTHYAMIGMAHIANGYPLYYDAVNEKGLAMAGLNFVGNAVYGEIEKNAYNVSPFEFIPWIFGQCATVEQAKQRLREMTLANIPLSEQLPLSQLHWIIAGHGKAITVEAVESGLQVYDNPVGVLTNNPPFPEQLLALNNYMGLSPKEPENRLSDKVPLHAYSRGMGAIGLPGDWSSASRFVRACFVKLNAVSGTSEAESVSQFFHILGAVSQPKGTGKLADGRYEVTLYASCCNADTGVYYYTTYGNHQISAVDMRRENLDAAALITYPLLSGEQIYRQN